ncbi:MAG TPA: dihydrofolate reductase family protein [Acidimicrobiia bacterium]|nr:dihydrofolate reductase family protein [Acidimicrobiia bacterium]
MIRQLVDGAPVDDLVDLALTEHRGGPRLMLNMVASLDGATALRGGTTALADQDDQALFHALRAACDVVLVGAETVRAEDYGPVRLDDDTRAARRAVGLEPVPALAIVSRRLDLDRQARVFSNPDLRPLIITGADAPPERVEALSDRAQIVVAGERGADPAAIRGLLHDRGHEVILGEGGPTLNGQLVAVDAVDEINLTVSPLMVAGSSSRVSDHPLTVENRFRRQRVLAGESMLFLRYVRAT